MSRVEELEALIAPVVAELGCELWGIEFFMQGRRSALRIYIDSENGVGIEDCERVSRQVSALFDVEDPIKSAYTLEVSSPGIDRPLFQLEQYRRYVGETVAVRLRAPYEGRRKFQGTLRGIEGDEIVIQIDDNEYLLPFETIEKGNVIAAL